MTTRNPFVCASQSLDQLRYSQHQKHEDRQKYQEFISLLTKFGSTAWKLPVWEDNSNLKDQCKNKQKRTNYTIKKSSTQMPIIFIFRKVIMWDSKTSLAFWRPKNTHSRVIPFSIKVCFTIFSGSLSKVTTFCWTISCKAWSSKKRKQRKMWPTFFPPNIQTQSFSLLGGNRMITEATTENLQSLSFSTTQCVEG